MLKYKDPGYDLDNTKKITEFCKKDEYKGHVEMGDFFFALFFIHLYVLKGSTGLPDDDMAKSYQTLSDLVGFVTNAYVHTLIDGNELEDDLIEKDARRLAYHYARVPVNDQRVKVWAKPTKKNSCDLFFHVLAHMHGTDLEHHELGEKERIKLYASCNVFYLAGRSKAWRESEELKL